MKEPKNNFLVTMCLVVVSSLLVSACHKDKNNPIENVYVNITINPASTQYLGLNSVGGYEYITGGVDGIIVYRKSTDEFVALERSCTYDPQGVCRRVEVEASRLVAVDSACGSRFLLLDGSVVKGPAEAPLKQYNAAYDGYYLYITN